VDEAGWSESCIASLFQHGPPVVASAGEHSPRAHNDGTSTGRRGTSAVPSAQTTTTAISLEGTISADKSQSWAYAESFIEEDDVLLRARERAAQLGCSTILPGAGAALSVLAAAVGARSVVEIGTGTGVASVCLLRGMHPDGVLTTIDLEVEHQRAAKAAFVEAGIRATRTRAISGRPLDVLPRLTDGAYDLVVVSADATTSYPAYVEQALRLLRPGGVLALDGALWHGQVADPARRDEATTTIREVGRHLRSDERVLSALLPSGDGLLVAVRR
jgi:predicted O-methyltransferase YrrM